MLLLRHCASESEFYKLGVAGLIALENFDLISVYIQAFFCVNKGLTMSDKSRSHKSSSTPRDKTKKSNFLSDFGFLNELADPSAKMKLLPLKRDPDRYCKYQSTSLEKNWTPKLYVDLGTPLDVLDMAVYSRRRSKKVPLDPEDEALLRDDDIDPIKPSKKDGLKKKEKPSDKGLSWLLNSHSASPLSMNSTKQYLTKKQAKELRESRHQNPSEASTSREKEIQDILASFQACKSKPVHKVNSQLNPKRIQPLTPYFDRSDYGLLIANIVDAPTADSEIDKKVNAAGRLKDESRLEEDLFDENEDISNSLDEECHCDLQPDNVDDPDTYPAIFEELEAKYLPLPKIVLRETITKEGKLDEEVKLYPVPKSLLVRSGFTVDERGFVVSKVTSGSGTGSTA